MQDHRQGATLAGSANLQVPRTPSMQTQREVVVAITDPSAVQRLRVTNLHNLDAHVERAIAQSGNETTARVKVLSSNQLRKPLCVVCASLDPTRIRICICSTYSMALVGSCGVFRTVLQPCRLCRLPKMRFRPVMVGFPSSHLRCPCRLCRC
jgi:hypothetical protein